MRKEQSAACVEVEIPSADAVKVKIIPHPQNLTLLINDLILQKKFEKPLNIFKNHDIF